MVTIKKKVFVSHPFAGDPEGNRVKVDKICKQLEADGFSQYRHFIRSRIRSTTATES